MAETFVRGDRGLLHWEDYFERNPVSVTYIRVNLANWAHSFDPMEDTDKLLPQTVETILRCVPQPTAQKPLLLLADWRGLNDELDSLEKFGELFGQYTVVQNFGLRTEIARGMRQLIDNGLPKGVVSHKNADLANAEPEFVNADKDELALESESDSRDVCISVLPQKIPEPLGACVEKYCGSLTQLEREIREAEDHFLKRRAADCFIAEPQFLRSTPLWANGFFNAKEILGCPTAFCWFCYAMARQVNHVISKYIKEAIATEQEVDISREIRLLACTQNGVSLAVAVSHLLKHDVLIDGKQAEVLGVDVIDRFGPSQKFIEEYCSREDRKPLCYVFVGDFVIAGTELKIAEVHSYHRRVRLRDAVVLGSVLKPSECQGDRHAVTTGEHGRAEVEVDTDVLGSDRVCLSYVVDVFSLHDNDGKPLPLSYSFPGKNVN